MRRIIAALAAIALTLGVVGMGVASAAPATAAQTVTTTGQTSTVVAQFPDPYGVWILSVGGALARMFPDGNIGGGITIYQFGGSTDSGARFRGFTFVYPNGTSVTYRWEGGVVTVYLN